MRQGAFGVLAAGALPIWLASGPARAAAARRGDPLLVVIFQRGGADGLHVLPPLGDPGYARLRGALALDDALPFAGDFRLHPALEKLAPLVDRGELAAVHAAGSPDSTRSHFSAQDVMEAGTPGGRRIVDGWLARALQDADAGAFDALALTDSLPFTLRGSGAFAMADPRRFGVPGASPRALDALERAYTRSGPGDAFGDSARRALGAIGEFRSQTGFRAPRGAGRPARAQLEVRARALVELERTGLPMSAVMLESSGWDTHLRQGTDKGTMRQPLRDLAAGVSVLHRGLAERRDLLVVVMTEFGRTVRPNGSGGSDHGHGSAMLVIGPRVRPGVHGAWPGLQPDRLWEGRDLPVANDYRHVLWEVLRAHLGRAPPAATFPGFDARPLGLLA
ncbi:MAG: DUF1501 domain-containing protein [Deltaproteobacteria bacterium]|nr:DUF1501 domain-containing protein [Deltaproteobacteria bacterium]